MSQRVLSVSLPVDVLHALDELAMDKHYTRSAMVRELIRVAHTRLKLKTSKEYTQLSKKIIKKGVK